MTGGLLLDFYGTIAEAVAWGPTFEDVLAAHGLAPPDRGAPAWSAFDHDGHEHLAHSRSREHYVAWERERFSGLARAAGAVDGTVGPVVDALYAAAKTYELAVYDEVEETLTALRARGLLLAVCSNWDWDLPDVIDRLGLAHHFDLVVTSARVGARKPHPRIYRHTLAALGLTPPEAAFVGDSLAPDVVGPMRHGLRAFHLVRDGAAGSLPPGAVPLTTLRQLVEHL